MTEVDSMLTQYLKYSRTEHGKNSFSILGAKIWNSKYYYMANPVLGKSPCSDWLFLGQDFAVWIVSMKMVQPVHFCFGAKPANSKFATKTAKKNCEYCHSSQ